jgi:hypothetical protein
MKDGSNKDLQWARRQAAEAQNHIFDSLGERYGLRIIPGTTSFLVLPNNISRSTAVGAILHPGGPAHTSTLAGRGAPWTSVSVGGGTSVGGATGLGIDGGGEGSGDFVSAEVGFVLAMGSDENLLRRLNELEGAETCSTSGKGTNAKWRIGKEDVGRMLWQFVNVA